MFLEFFVMLILATLAAILALGAGYLLFSGSPFAKFCQRYGSGLAAVVILLIVFGDIIPEVLESDLETPLMTVLILVGLAVCFIFSLIIRRYHKHGDTKKIKNKEQAYSMLVVDSLHTMLDGVVIGIAFASGLSAGIFTIIAILAHEIPQKISDFALMLRSKMAKPYILRAQGIAAFLSVPTAVVAFFIGDLFESALPTLLSFTAGFFLYIAINEIIEIITGAWSRAEKATPKSAN